MSPLFSRQDPSSRGLGMTSQRARDRLVDRLVAEGIRDRRVLDVMRQLPRHLFIDEALASRAYGPFCMSGHCTSMCLAACTIGGVLGGVFLGVFAYRRKAPMAMTAYAAALALLTGALGCAWLGFGGVAGLGAGLLVSMTLATVSRRA